jgi:hypothetical protein
MHFLKFLKAFFTPSTKNLWVFDAEDQAKASAEYRSRLDSINHSE